LVGGDMPQGCWLLDQCASCTDIQRLSRYPLSIHIATQRSHGTDITVPLMTANEDERDERDKIRLARKISS
jgi:hypothetical protein